MEKRVLLAVSLSFLVLVLYQTLLPPPPPTRPVAPASGQGAATVAPAEGTGGAAPATEPLPEAAQITGATEEQDIVVESAAVRAVFTNRGAELKSWQLKDYLDDEGRPVDVVPAGIPPEEARAFALVPADPTLARRLHEALFSASATGLDVDQGQRVLAFEYEDASGLRATKRFEFAPNGLPYVVLFTADVSQGGQAVPVALSSGPGIGDTARAVGSSSFLSPSYYQPPQALLQQGRDLTFISADDLPAQPVHEGVFTSLGVSDHYFLSAVLPGGRSVRGEYDTLTVTTPAGPRRLVRYRAGMAGGLDAVQVFLGPKQYDVLSATNLDLVRTINFGIFDWLVVPLLRALNWIDRGVGNYGWSIILLTLFINAAIAPLRHRSVVSMRRMQELQPQVKAIQDRYGNLKATDPARQKLNAEMMALYREKGVNPASGCLPMLLTMPVLFAFYSMLSQAIELRGAPFMGWINDLSRHDPLYITPLLMGASMVWQQKLTPSTADPIQQRVMMFMPVLFTFMFLWAPSGLVIYWLVSNLWAIGQQYVTNRLIGPPKIVVARPPTERRMKQAGSGRTE
jgi:YidC/Oxa1 family membrane protein insertase